MTPRREANDRPHRVCPAFVQLCSDTTIHYTALTRLFHDDVALSIARRNECDGASYESTRVPSSEQPIDECCASNDAYANNGAGSDAIDALHALDLRSFFLRRHRALGCSISQITLRMSASSSVLIDFVSNVVLRKSGGVPCREHCKAASMTRGKSDDVYVSGLTKLSAPRNSSVFARPYGRSTLRPRSHPSLEKMSARERAGSPGNFRPTRSSTRTSIWRSPGANDRRAP